MTDSHRFLADMALVLGTAAVTTVVAQRVRLPVVFGYLLAGMLVGPHVPVPLVATVETVSTLAELGVVLLMFALGLEFRVRRVVEVAATAGAPALAETSVMFTLGYLLASAFGWSPAERIVAGALVAISSTTIIARAFDDVGERGRVADLVFGILIVEDLLAILLIVVVGTIGGPAGDSPSLVQTVVRLALFLLVVLGAGLAVVPSLVRRVLALGRAETSLVLAMGLCFGGAWLAQTAGYSVALGAFLVGSLTAESGESHTMEPLVHPVRDLFVAVFFVSVGMLIDFRVLAEHWVAVLAFTALVVTGKIVAVTLATLLAGHPLREATRAGMSLAQIGEFSFIIASAAIATGRVRDYLYPLAVAVSAITTLLTPWLVRRSTAAAMALDAALPRSLQTLLALYGSWIERLRVARTESRAPWARPAALLLADAVLIALLVVGVLLLGDEARAALTTATGRPSLARGLVAGGALVLAVPPLVGFVRTAHVLARVLALRALPAGAAGRLDYARAPREALTLALQASLMGVLLVPLIAVVEPLLPSRTALLLVLGTVALLGVAFWRVAMRLQAHATAGAEVIMLALGQQAARGASTDDLSRTMERMSPLLPGLGEPALCTLSPTAWAAGQSLSAIQLRGRTGATILGISRGVGEPVVLPDGHTRLEAGDVLALAGTSDGVARARALLEHGTDVGAVPKAAVTP